MARTPERRTGKLVEIFNELLVLGTSLRDAKDLGNPEHLRTRVQRLFQTADEQSKTVGVGAEVQAQAKYAVAAFVDEMITHSSWVHREQWSAKPLQYDFFGDFVAGEGFFTRLETIRRTLPVDTDLLEVYALCLILGFEGQYRFHERERLSGLMADVTKEVQAKRGETPVLSPHGKRPEELLELVKRELPVWVVLTTSAGIVLLVYLVLSGLINNQAAHLLNQLTKILQEPPA